MHKGVQASPLGDDLHAFLFQASCGTTACTFPILREKRTPCHFLRARSLMPSALQAYTNGGT